MAEAIDKISKLLAQAEGAGTTEAERESFMAKAQELAAVNRIDLALARQHQADKTKREEPIRKSFKIGDRNQKNLKWYIELFDAVARANNVHLTIASSNRYVFPHGFPSDIEVVERLYNSLLVQMVASADAALKRGENKKKERLPKIKREEIAFEDRDWGGYNRKSNRYYDEMPDDQTYYEECVDYGYKIKDWYTGRERKPFPPPTYREVPELDADGDPIIEERVVSSVDGRVFRSNFYQGFIARAASQMREANRRAREEHDEGQDEETVKSTAVAVRGREQEASKFFEDETSHMRFRSWGGAESSDFSEGAYQAGTRAAAVADYGDDSTGLKGTRGTLEA